MILILLVMLEGKVRHYQIHAQEIINVYHDNAVAEKKRVTNTIMLLSNFSQTWPDTEVEVSHTCVRIS